MARLTDKPYRRAQVVANAPVAADPAALPATGQVVAPAEPIAAIEPAIDAAVDHAAAERLDEPVAPIAIEPAPAATVLAVADDAMVLPKPELIAEPGRPEPLVTASPPLAAEPSAADVIDAAAAAATRKLADAGVPVPFDALNRDGPYFAAAGQPVLAIEPTRAVDAATVAADALDPVALAAAAPHAPERVTVVEIVGPHRGRWRGGLAFGPTPRRFLLSQLTDAQLEAIAADPQLATGVREVDHGSVEIESL